MEGRFINPKRSDNSKRRSSSNDVVMFGNGIHIVDGKEYKDSRVVIVRDGVTTVDGVVQPPSPVAAAAAAAAAPPPSKVRRMTCDARIMNGDDDEADAVRKVLSNEKVSGKTCLAAPARKVQCDCGRSDCGGRVSASAHGGYELTSKGREFLIRADLSSSDGQAGTIQRVMRAFFHGPPYKVGDQLRTIARAMKVAQESRGPRTVLDAIVDDDARQYEHHLSDMVRLGYVCDHDEYVNLDDA